MLIITLNVKPEYNSKIKCFAALTPAVYAEHLHKGHVRVGTLIEYFTVGKRSSSKLIQIFFYSVQSPEYLISVGFGNFKGRQLRYRKEVFRETVFDLFRMMYTPIQKKLILGALRIYCFFVGLLTYGNLSEVKFLAYSIHYWPRKQLKKA
jgi:hypothetical protein